MKLLVVLCALAALVVACGLLWGQEDLQPVTGTIVSVGAVTTLDDGEWQEFSLRVDEQESKQLPGKPGDVLTIRLPKDQFRRMGLGDQVRSIVEVPASAGATLVAGEAVVLGRGEFVNPGEKATVDLGPPQAKVLVKMFAPLQPACHQRTAAVLKELAKAEPERVRIQIFDMQQPEGRAEVNRERLKCATVLVNNRYQFTIRENDRERPVELWHKPNETSSTYNSEDVPIVVRQEIARLYPEPKKGEGEKAIPVSAPAAKQ